MTSSGIVAQDWWKKRFEEGACPNLGGSGGGAGCGITFDAKCNDCKQPINPYSGYADTSGRRINIRVIDCHGGRHHTWWIYGAEGVWMS